MKIVKRNYIALWCLVITVSRRLRDELGLQLLMHLTSERESISGRVAIRESTHYSFLSTR
jgi:hypothetical protein